MPRRGDLDMGAYETTIDTLAGELSRVEAVFRGLTEQELSLIHI